MNHPTPITDEDRLHALLNELEILAGRASTEGVQHKVRDLLQSFDSEAATNADARLADCAAELYRLRRRRELQFSRELLGEPGWDLLLDLFVNTVRGIPVSVTGACIATNVPTTTALRWLAVLDERGLLTRYPDESDRRVVLVRLTDDGLNKMRTILSEIVNRGFSPQESAPIAATRRR